MTKDMPKTISTIPQDILDLFDPDKSHEVCEENIEQFGEAVKEIMRSRLKEQTTNHHLRMSNVGKPECQLWYQMNGYEGERLTPKTFMKFLYGDIIEALLLFLVREAGHTVEHEQREVEIDGIKGHIDAVIDGVVVDVKSASPHGFKKFDNGTLVEDDPFGYVQQISNYVQALREETGSESGGFLAMDKVSGDICVMEVGPGITHQYSPNERIARVKDVIASDTPPPRCFTDVPDGKSGNMKLPTTCSYCPFKHECWPGLRTFLYANGPRFLTKVVKVPDVFEVEA